ncbi:hypothetical protein BC477_04030 [Clavibacter michiganensis subsp. michiganensis]|uniref:Uncharacterized protein n=1 Tax=Clavibacter michiganensis subsp. michiganensis TaxID=33013 RepID=A0A251XKI1_CLAMM|nr:hypothetical protein BC477_04030 [Clavibacter michiganensis subsp. michiganensis]OUE03880.1 hypothetical protein CMMCAS07_02965 [Clavibacter michiganensis subsp. michiganensis]
MSVVATGFCRVHASGTGVPAGTLPNSWRAASTTEETGLYSANTRSGVGRESLGTNALLMNVSGNSTRNEALLITSGLRTLIPRNAITHDSAYANSSSRATPASASRRLERTRQPTTKPVASITTMEKTLMRRSPLVRPTRTADGLIGRVRNRSMIPSLRSFAIAEPE